MVERLWPGATWDAVCAAVYAIEARCRQLADEGVPVRCLGATFIPADESLSCRFEGTEQAVRAAHQLAGVGFDRLVVIRELAHGAPEDPVHRSSTRVVPGAKGMS